MRSCDEVIELLLNTAKNDERIRAAVLQGSRANAEAPEDIFQDYDMVYCVHDVAPFWDNRDIIKRFGRLIMLQTPETSELMRPMGDGHFTYLMLFEDGSRIDLSFFTVKAFSQMLRSKDCEPSVILLDKDAMLPKPAAPDGSVYHIKPPAAKLFADCCNEFFWIQQNTAKGIWRDEIPYAMHMHEVYARDMLHQMLDWRIGHEHDFGISTGKCGKYYKRYLSGEDYERFLKTYAAPYAEKLWDAVFEMCALFRDSAMLVAEACGFIYPYGDDSGMSAYLERVRLLAPDAKSV